MSTVAPRGDTPLQPEEWRGGNLIFGRQPAPNRSAQLRRLDDLPGKESRVYSMSYGNCTGGPDRVLHALNDGLYNQAVITALVECIRGQGIRAVLEFDMPRHAARWRHAEHQARRLMPIWGRRAAVLGRCDGSWRDRLGWANGRRTDPACRAPLGRREPTPRRVYRWSF